jgi:hypothetical protein
MYKASRCFFYEFNFFVRRAAQRENEPVAFGFAILLEVS